MGETGASPQLVNVVEKSRGENVEVRLFIGQRAPNKKKPTERLPRIPGGALTCLLRAPYPGRHLRVWLGVKAELSQPSRDSLPLTACAGPLLLSPCPDLRQTHFSYWFRSETRREAADCTPVSPVDDLYPAGAVRYGLSQVQRMQKDNSTTFQALSFEGKEKDLEKIPHHCCP